MSYVKFVRGTPQAWARIPAEVKDPDCFYFISEPESDFGKLYIGDKLVIGGEGSTTLEKFFISNAEEGQVLTYNAEKGGWVNSSPTASPVFEGKTAGLVPENTKEDEGIYFLTNKGTWVSVEFNEEDTKTLFEEIQNKLDEIQATLDLFNESDIANLSSRVGNLEELLLDEEKKNPLFVSKIEMNKTVGNLEDLFINNVTIVEALNDLNSRLVWEEIQI